MFTQIVVIAFINLNLQLCNPHTGVAAILKVCVCMWGTLKWKLIMYI